MMLLPVPNVHKAMEQCGAMVIVPGQMKMAESANLNPKMKLMLQPLYCNVVVVECETCYLFFVSLTLRCV